MTVQRVQFDIPEERLKELDSLRAELGLETRKDLFNNALTLLEWAVEEIKSGRVIASIDESSDSYREMHMPIFSAIKRVLKKRLAAVAG